MDQNHAMTVEERLQETARLRTDAENARRTASRAFYQAVRAAAKQNMPKTRIAEVAGISRQTVHQILKEER